MKNHRFPWLRNRTTDNRKCEKARNIKEKCTIEMFSTVSKQLVALRSSASADLLSKPLKNPGITTIPGFFCNQRRTRCHPLPGGTVFFHLRRPLANAIKLSSCSSLNPLAIAYNSFAFEGLAASVSKKSFGVIPRYSQI